MKIRELFETSAHYDTTELVQYWIDKNKINSTSFHIRDDGSIDILDDDFVISDVLLNEDGEFPIKINSSHRLTIFSNKFSSFKNFPTVIACEHPKQFSLRLFNKLCINLKSLEGCPTHLEGIVDLHNGPKLSLSRIDKYIKRIQTALYVPNEYKGPMLSILKIKELQWVDTLGGTAAAPLARACDIVSTHLVKDRNIMDCQEELMNAGLEEYAQL